MKWVNMDSHFHGNALLGLVVQSKALLGSPAYQQQNKDLKGK